ncbi:MAG: hypothetical protein FJY74_06025 [Candidatus Eisenbacteria bacterium]|nr:hypothetical protein [Candidatus Eisenbacteria bacterium]
MVTESRETPHGRYTRDAAKHAFFAAIVERCADEVAAAVGERHAAAVFLIGAPSRGEATVVETSSGLHSLSDVDLVCIVSPGADLAASREAARQAVARLNPEIAPLCTGVDVSVRPCERAGRPTPLIAHYELARSPMLVRGDAAARDALGQVDIHDIPPSDALRFVHNRCIERLLAGGAGVGNAAACGEIVTLRAQYTTAKLMLDLVTAFLFVRREVPLGYEDRVRLFVTLCRTREQFRALAQEVAPFLDELPHWARFKTTGDWRALREALPEDALAGLRAPRFAFALWRRVLGETLGTDLFGATLPEAIARLAEAEGPARSLARSWKALRSADARSLFPATAVLRGALRGSPVPRAYITGLLLFFADAGGAPREWTRTALARYAPFALPADAPALTDDAMRQALLPPLARFHREVLLGRRPEDGGTGTGAATD